MIAVHEERASNVTDTAPNLSVRGPWVRRICHLGVRPYACPRPADAAILSVDAELSERDASIRPADARIRPADASILPVDADAHPREAVARERDECSRHEDPSGPPPSSVTDPLEARGQARIVRRRNVD